jgi:hypothetical protein
VQELLRHASMKVTTDVYMQAVNPQETRGAEQTGEDGPEKNGFSGLIEPNWTMTENCQFSEVISNVGVPDGI